jgi:hypothetical protein
LYLVIGLRFFLNLKKIITSWAFSLSRQVD